MPVNCDCILAGERQVPYKGNVEGEILIVGESPDYEEVRSNNITEGKNWRTILKELRAVHLPIEICFFANAIRCKFQKDQFKSKEIKEIKNSCRPNLSTIIKHVQPKVIVTFGALALEQVLKMKGIKKARGNFYFSDEFNCWVLPNYAPGFVFRNANEEDNFKRVFVQLKDFMDNGWQVKDTMDFEWKEVNSIRDLLDGGLPRAKDGSCYYTAVDTETQGLEWFSPEGVLISYSVAASEKLGYNVILHEECQPGEGDFDVMIERGGTKKSPDMQIVGVKKDPLYDQKMEELKELFERSDIQKYFMNQKYDIHWLEREGIEVINSAPLDVALASHTLDAPRYMNANLAYLLESWCGISGAYKDDFSDFEKSDMLYQLKTQREKFNRYAAFDAVGTLRVALRIIEEFDRDRKSLNYYINFAHPVETKFLYELETNGILIDEVVLPVVSDEINQIIEEKEQEFLKLCPDAVVDKHATKFKLTRKAILMDALFNYENVDKGEHINIGFGITPKDLSPKTQLPKTSKDVLKVILDSERVPDTAKDLIHVYQDWSQYHTIRSRYIKQLEDCIAADGKLHPTYSLTYTSSGRTGARKPSIQNFPKRFAAAKLIRQLLIADEGKVLLETDHSMSELRWTAEEADEKNMKDIFRHGGDIHLFTGANLGGYTLNIGDKHSMIKELEEVYSLDESIVKSLRQNAKAVNFGLIYRMSALGLRNYAYQGFGVKMTDKESSVQRREFFKLYPGITAWHDKVLREMEETGSIVTVFGRKIPIPNIYSSDKKTAAEAERFGINAKIQGPSSDYTLLGGLNVIEGEKYDRRVIKACLFIHDAVIWEVDLKRLDEMMEEIAYQMVHIETENRFGFSLSIPFLVEGEYGFNLKDTEEYQPPQKEAA